VKDSAAHLGASAENFSNVHVAQRWNKTFEAALKQAQLDAGNYRFAKVIGVMLLTLREPTA
jgi:hypothetical protein